MSWQTPCLRALCQEVARLRAQPPCPIVPWRSANRHRISAGVSDQDVIWGALLIGLNESKSWNCSGSHFPVCMRSTEHLLNAALARDASGLAFWEKLRISKLKILVPAEPGPINQTNDSDPHCRNPQVAIKISVDTKFCNIRKYNEFTSY